VTEKHNGVTYADVTSKELPTKRFLYKELPTKEFFNNLGLIVPKGIKDSCIISTPGRKGNCLLYSVARLIYKDPNHKTVDDMRFFFIFQKTKNYITTQNNFQNPSPHKLHCHHKSSFLDPSFPHSTKSTLEFQLSSPFLKLLYT